MWLDEQAKQINLISKKIADNISDEDDVPQASTEIKLINNLPILVANYESGEDEGTIIGLPLFSNLREYFKICMSNISRFLQY